MFQVLLRKGQSELELTLELSEDLVLETVSVSHIGDFLEFEKAITVGDLIDQTGSIDLGELMVIN